MGIEDGKLKKSARRKPLTDVSNGTVKSAKSPKSKKEEMPPPSANDRVDVGEDPLDRILFLHSDITSILSQIDELVVQAVNVKATNKNTSKEIKSFADALSEIRSSLVPWVPRLQKAFDVCPSEAEIQSVEISVATLTKVNEDDTADTPELTKHESLVSPSPLVSWRATDCTIERGKQLFLLTPLPRPKTVMSKVPVSSNPIAREEVTSSSTASVPLLGAKASLPNSAFTDAMAKNAEIATELDFASPPKLPMGDFSLLVTPSLKNPPKSCMLLEPDNEFMTRKIDGLHKSTPFPVESKNLYDSTDSENSSNGVSDRLSLKYPELIGIKPSCMFKSGTKALDASPAWMMSPPKCCTLLEPPDAKPVKDNAPLDRHLQEPTCDVKQQIFHQGNFGGKFITVESTPMWKGSESTVQRGIRPGENTLKKELWTKFEAATTSGLRFNFGTSQGTSGKGFLDKLEEVSCEEKNSHHDLLR